MSLIRPLPPGAVDIIGDVHGEHEALVNLITHLGYDTMGNHPQGRRLVFVGDFCDRGPNSPAVIRLVEDLVGWGKGFAVLGNHEINLLRNDPKDGAGWYFDSRDASDRRRYPAYVRASDENKTGILTFLQSLPVAVERADLRVVHAAWIAPQIEVIRHSQDRGTVQLYDDWENEAVLHAERTALNARMTEELRNHPHSLEDEAVAPTFLHAHAERDMSKQMMNPLKVLTSGVEVTGTEPFYAGGRWRFVDRAPWWDTYDEAPAVVIGHYWRRANGIDRQVLQKGDKDLFANTHPASWHGKRGNVFCVDFSVGARWRSRKDGKPLHADFKLAALQWPERVLQFDDGRSLMTTGFGREQHGT